MVLYKENMQYDRFYCTECYEDDGELIEVAKTYKGENPQYKNKALDHCPRCGKFQDFNVMNNYFSLRQDTITREVD